MTLRGETHLEVQRVFSEVADAGELRLAAEATDVAVFIAPEASRDAVAILVVWIRVRSDFVFGNRFDQPEAEQERHDEARVFGGGRRRVLVREACRLE